MALADLLTTTVSREAGPKPRDDQLDLFGLTHPGKVRKENQDHFLLATIHPQILIHGSSLPNKDDLPLRGERFGTIMLVADGVGSGAGEGASRLAVESITRYATSTMNCFYSTKRHAQKEFVEELKSAALEAHEAVRSAAAERPDIRSMATTLTVVVFFWPWAYVLQVGDSRFYYYLDGELKQVTRDQTIAQDLMDKGVLPKERAADSPFAHVLASAIGGRSAEPDVSAIMLRTGCVALCCSDGLTKHVSDDEIAEQIRTAGSSEQICRSLLDMVLERGGSDNVTILVGQGKRD